METAVVSTKVPKGQIALWWLGQSGYLLKSHEDEYLMIDPYLTETISKGYPPYVHVRLVPPVLSPARLKIPLHVFFTHTHQDHLDPNTVVQLAGEECRRFYGPVDVTNRLLTLGIPRERVAVIDQPLQIGTFKVTPVKAVHSCPSYGYLITCDGHTLYFSGDTSLFCEMAELRGRNVDVAFLCINGQAGNLDCASAVYAASLIRPRIAVPNHYGMYADNTAEPTRFAKMVQDQLDGIQVRILKEGEKWLLSKRG